VVIDANIAADWHAFGKKPLPSLSLPETKYPRHRLQLASRTADFAAVASNKLDP
jgi:hypothetical protein